MPLPVRQTPTPPEQSPQEPQALFLYPLPQSLRINTSSSLMFCRGHRSEQTAILPPASEPNVNQKRGGQPPGHHHRRQCTKGKTSPPSLPDPICRDPRSIPDVSSPVKPLAFGFYARARARGCIRSHCQAYRAQMPIHPQTTGLPQKTPPIRRAVQRSGEEEEGRLASCRFSGWAIVETTRSVQYHSWSATPSLSVKQSVLLQGKKNWRKNSRVRIDQPSYRTYTSCSMIPKSAIAGKSRKIRVAQATNHMLHAP